MWLQMNGTSFIIRFHTLTKQVIVKPTPLLGAGTILLNAQDGPDLGRWSHFQIPVCRESARFGRTTEGFEKGGSGEFEGQFRQEVFQEKQQLLQEGMIN